MSQNSIPGLSVSIGYKGELIWSKGFGFADLKNKIPVTSQTRFRIGSISKTITSIAMGRLMEKNLVDIFDPVQKYVPYFPNKKWAVTSRDVMGHIAGIRHYRNNEFLNDQFYPSVPSGLSLFLDDTLLFKPKTKYKYSSYGWNLVSAVVEGASGMDFLSFMEDSVFSVLNLHSIMAEHRDSLLTNLAKFYIAEDNIMVEAPKVDNSYKWAGGGFIGNTNDLINFILKLNQSNFISPSTLNLLQTPLTLENGSSTYYGLGWSVRNTAFRKKWVGHSGGSIGGRAMLMHFP